MQAAFDDTAVAVLSLCDLNVKEVGEPERVYYITSARQTRLKRTVYHMLVLVWYELPRLHCIAWSC